MVESSTSNPRLNRDHSPVVSNSAANWYPWARLNLCRNPFGELTRDQRAELAILEADEMSSCAVGHGEAVQLIGECGRGKTTRLLAIQRHYPASSYVYLAEREPCPAIPVGDPLLIDEAQRLPKRIRRQVFSSRLPLVLATHDDLGHALHRAGYSVRTILIGEQNTPELVCRLLNRRIEASRLCSGPLPVVTNEQAERLVARFGSNVRAIEHYLYESIQTQVAQDGEVRFID